MRRCDGLVRREFLRVGGLTALGLSLVDALRLRGAAAAPRKMPSCILVWLDGGPSHLDMFDLKPDAPEEVRGPFRPADTSVRGIQICEYFHQLQKQMQHCCLIRSMTSELGEHNFGSHYLLTGYKPSPVLEYPSYGSVLTQVRAGQAELPRYISVPSNTRYAGNGFLPASTRPFAVNGDPSRPDFRVRDLEGPQAPVEGRLARRREFLAQLDGLNRDIEANRFRQERDAHFEQAYKLILSPAAKNAFAVQQEKPAVRQRYGNQKLGQSCLLARRLVEAGCPFVTVTDSTWDHHNNVYRTLKEGYVGGTNGKLIHLDQALSALLSDLHERGRLQETLVIVMGEFGRTPKLNVNAGRDHWPRAFSVLLAGGGVKGGQVVGQSDARGESPAERPVTPADLARTLYTLLGIDPELELHTADGRPVQVNAEGSVVKECLV